MKRHPTLQVDIGNRLKACRLQQGLSQRALAKKAGVTNGLISQIEQNSISPSIASLKKILDVLSMSLADFFTSADGGQITGQEIAGFRCNEASGAVHDPKRYRRPWVNRRFLHCAVKIGLHFYLHFPRNAFAEHLKVRCY